MYALKSFLFSKVQNIPSLVLLCTGRVSLILPQSSGVSFPLAGGRHTIGSLVGNDLIVKQWYESQRWLRGQGPTGQKLGRS